MPGELADLAETFSNVWQRFSARMRGLTDAEYAWHPVADDRLSLHWRINHIADLLAMQRNAQWLSVPVPPGRPVTGADAATAAAAFDRAQLAFTWWQSVLTSMHDASLSAAVGAIAHPYAEATRRSFVLHVLDELTHHTAEAAILRDLYAGRPA